MPDYTKEQLLAINTRDCDLLVSAAAGSGKTAVLVERVIKMVTDKARPVDMSRLLVVTFTEAAAAEMRSRIREALAKKLEANPGDHHLRNQESQLNDASIMTIHAFCLSVLRKYFHLAELDPFFSVADQTEGEILKRDVCNELFEDMYMNENSLNMRVLGEEDNGLFLELVENYGGSITDEALGEQVIRLYDYAQGEPWPEKWLELAGREDEDFTQSSWYDFLMSDIKDSLEDAAQAAEKVLAITRSPLGKNYLSDKYISPLENDAMYIENCLKARDFEELSNALDFEFDRLSSAKVKGLSQSEEEETAVLKEQIRELRDKHVKLPIKNLKDKVFAKPLDEAAADLSRAGRGVRGLCGLAIELGRRFTFAKRERNMLDFSDLEHECIKILVNEDGLTPAAKELAGKYDEIFIDEYQDSNAVQELLMSSVSGAAQGKRRNTFMVGDVKQSIYRFRLANPEIFNKKYLSFNREEAGEQRLIPLSKNFRSRRAVLDAVNCVFGQIFSRKLGGTDYGADEMLNFGADYPEDTGSHVTEIICVETEESFDEDHEALDVEDDIVEMSKAEKEAAVAAKRIKELLDSGFVVGSKDGSVRPVRPSDMAILLRSPRNIAETYLRALKEQNIIGESDITEGYFESPEVLTALSFLRIIDNPRQDIPLAAVLYSRVYGLRASELLNIKQSSQAGSLYESALEYMEKGTDERLREGLSRFFADLGRWREMAVKESVSALLWAVLEESRLFLLEGVLAGGVLRQANLQKLYSYALNYEKTRMRGLFSFIRFIDKIIKSGKDTGISPAVEEAEDAVKITSIHKSKGLEFPVVLVCGLGKRFNLRDTQGRLLFHNELGVGAKTLDLESRVHSDTLKRLAISAKLRQESLSEELRILYVAMTRAREKLILIGEKGKSDPALLAKDLTDLELPYRLLKKNNRFMDFLLQALARPEFMKDKIKIIRQGPVERVIADEVTDKVIVNVENSNINSREISDKLFYEYPYNLAARVPRKLSVTEIKRLYYSEQVKESEQIIRENVTDLPDPAFTVQSAVLNAAARGTVFHMVMERLPMNIKTPTEVEDFIVSLINDKFMTPEEAESVDIRRIVRFLNSDLGARIRNADRVWREQNFIINVPAAEINPQWAGLSDTGKDCVMVHGIMDCVILEEDRLTLIDYKTGRFTDRETEIRRYQLQMKIYARAINEHFRRPVSEALMYYFSQGIALKISD